MLSDQLPDQAAQCRVLGQGFGHDITRASQRFLWGCNASVSIDEAPRIGYGMSLLWLGLHPIGQGL
jgi:hypothetical protein